jgi:pimeloyl-ACP methyl ester carboxylesterase
MAFVDLPSSPLAPGAAPVRIHYRNAGAGTPVVILHGGWGYDMYPFQRQIEALSDRHRIVIPDRSGYGGSGRIDDLPPDFHHRAAAETRAVIDALDLPQPVLWGHSDGAIVALLLALSDPRRLAGLIVEAAHLYKFKPGSRAFFEAIAADPAAVGVRASGALAGDHGESWRQIVALHARAWLRFTRDARSPVEDFYGGRLGELKIPVLVVHGLRDPRTEPGELRALRAALERPPRADGSCAGAGNYREFAILSEGGHSPHSERATADTVTDTAVAFVGAVTAAAVPSDPAQPGGRTRP